MVTPASDCLSHLYDLLTGKADQHAPERGSARQHCPLSGALSLSAGPDCTGSRHVEPASGGSLPVGGRHQAGCWTSTASVHQSTWLPAVRSSVRPRACVAVVAGIEFHLLAWTKSVRTVIWGLAPTSQKVTAGFTKSR